MKPYLYTTSYTGTLPTIKIYRKVLFLFFLLCVTIIAVGQSGSGGGSNSGSGSSNSGSGNDNSGPGNNNGNRQLQFNNAQLETGSEGANGAVYRFPQVGAGIDALVKITGRSDNKVKLVSIDLTNTGWQKAFQPQIGYTGSGYKDWWMEFEISFVAKDGVSPATVSGFDVTALDVDGDGNKVREYVTFYKQKSYMLEDNSLLGVLNILESLLGLLTPGKKFTGPTTNYMNVDTGATHVMVTNHYDDASAFRFRLGGTGSGSINVERMYSMYFKSFAYTTPREFTLPLVLNDFNASLNNQKVMLTWQTGMEKELSHFVIERSIDGTNFTDAGMVFAGGSSGVKLNYSYADQVVNSPKGIIYYRLRMVHMDKKYQHSGIRVIRTNEAAAVVKMIAYPNPAVNEVLVTVPNSWQNKSVNYQVFNNSGQLVKQISRSAASQTQAIDVKELGAGLYVVKASTATETATQRIIKK